MKKEEPESKPAVVSPELEREYEPYGDEWRSELMKLTKKQIVEILRDECMERRMPTTYPAVQVEEKEEELWDKPESLGLTTPRS